MSLNQSPAILIVSTLLLTCTLAPSQAKTYAASRSDCLGKLAATDGDTGYAINQNNAKIYVDCMKHDGWTHDKDCKNTDDVEKCYSK